MLATNDGECAECMVSELFKQCFTLFNTCVGFGQRRDVECAAGFIIRTISEDNLKNTALDVFNGFRLFFGKAGMPGWRGVFQNRSDYSLIVIDKGSLSRVKYRCS